ncbi:MAG: AsmA family protein [Planctomycetes bacterium]|nr:AsmA family protein [Planctomycetota bacterium]
MNPTGRKPSRVWHWLRIPVYILIVLLLTATGLTTYLLYNSARVKTIVEQIVTVATDRPFHIYGDFDFNLGKVITVRATHIEWANPVWSSTPNMLTVEQADASVDLQSILSPPMIITNVSAKNAQLEFEWTQNGQFNWLLGSDNDAPETNKADEARHPLPLLLDKADLENVDILFKHPGLTEPLLLRVKHAQQQQDEKNHLVIDADTELDGRAVSLQGHIGPFPSLIIAGAIDFDAHLVGPNATLDLEGDVDNLMDLAGADFDLNWKAHEVAVILDILKLPPATAGPMDLEAHLLSDGEDIDGYIKGVVGEFSIDGSFHAQERAKLDDLHMSLISSGPSAGAAGMVAGIKGLPDSPYKLRVKVDAEESGLEVSELYVQTAETELTGTALLRQAPSLADADLDIELKGSNLALFQGLTNAVTFPELPFTADAKITNNGRGVPDSLTGKITLGQMHTDVSATLTDAKGFSGSTINYTLIFPHVQTFANLVGFPMVQSGELSTSGQADVTDSSVRLRNVITKLDNNQMTINGVLSTDNTKQPIKLDGKITGKSAANIINYFVTTDVVPALPYEFAGKFSIDGNRITLQQASGTLGTTKLTADGRILLGRSIPDITLNLSAKGSDFDELLQDKVLEQTLGDSFSITGNLSLSDTGLSVSKLKVDVRDGHLEGKVKSGWPDNPEEIHFDLEAHGDNLSNALPDISRYNPAPVTFRIEARGEANGENIHVDQANAAIGSATALFNGTIKLPPNLSAEDVNLDIRGSHLSDLGTIEGWQVSNVPFSMTTTISGAENIIAINDLNLMLGPNDLQGHITVDATTKPRVDLELTSHNIDLGTIMTREQEKALGKPTSESDVAADGRLIPDMRLPFDMLDRFDAQAKLQIDRFTRLNDVLTNISVNTRLEDGTLDANKLYAQTEHGYINASMRIQPKDQTHDIQLKLTARDAQLSWVNLSASDGKLYRGHDVDFQLVSQGENLRDIAASLNGFIWLRGAERRVENRAFGALFGDFISELVNLVNPFANKETYTTIDCDRVFFEAENGVLQTSPTVLFRTDKINIMAAGSINLTNEKIEFNIETTPRTGLGISASDLVNPFIRIGGTMGEPKLTLDPTGTLIEGSAAVMTGGLSILAKGLYERWLGPSDPCNNYTEQARKIRTKRDPDNVPAD